MKFTAASVMAILIFYPVVALSDVLPKHATVRDAVSEFSMELTQCFSYYSIVSHCMKNSGYQVSASKSEKIANSILPLIYKTGKAANLNNKELLRRLRMTLDFMKSEMDHSCRNLAAIYKYAYSCKALVEHPDSRLRTLLHKVH